ncbi:hypothetical protein N9L68_00940 [bacterium]|nr:hypothetical protein [bacterium]
MQSVEAQIRALRSALEERWSVSLGEDSRIYPFLIEYAAYLLSRCEVGHDGKTAYERMKGKVAVILGLEFGELVMWRPTKPGGKLGKLSPQWKLGVFLGANPISGEVTVVDGDGLRDVRSVHRRPLELRWNAGAASLLLRGIPLSELVQKRESMPYMDPSDVGSPGVEGWEDEIGAPSHERRRRKQRLETDREAAFRIRREAEAAAESDAEAEAFRESREMASRHEVAEDDGGRELFGSESDDEPLARLVESRRSPARPAGLFPPASINLVPEMDKGLTSDDISRIQILEKEILDEVRPHRSVHFNDFEESVGPILLGEVRRWSQGGKVDKTYRIDIAEKQMRRAGVGVEDEEEWEEIKWARDDITGLPLDPEEVAMARAEEISFIRGWECTRSAISPSAGRRRVKLQSLRSGSTCRKGMLCVHDG